MISVNRMVVRETGFDALTKGSVICEYRFASRLLDIVLCLFYEMDGSYSMEPWLLIRFLISVERDSILCKAQYMVQSRRCLTGSCLEDDS